VDDTRPKTDPPNPNHTNHTLTLTDTFSQSYKQERGCFVDFVRLATTLLKDEESERVNHVLACKFAKCLPIKKIHWQTQQ